MKYSDKTKFINMAIGASFISDCTKGIYKAFIYLGAPLSLFLLYVKDANRASIILLLCVSLSIYLCKKIINIYDAIYSNSMNKIKKLDTYSSYLDNVN